MNRSEIRRKFIATHFKYNKMGSMVSTMVTWSKHDIQYAREVLNRIEAGTTEEELISELVQLQAKETKQYGDLLKETE